MDIESGGRGWHCLVLSVRIQGVGFVKKSGIVLEMVAALRMGNRESCLS